MNSNIIGKDNKQRIIKFLQSIFYIIIVMLSPVLCHGQTKGVQAIMNQDSAAWSNQVYAVIVGISDYQSPKIPDLQYANKDAEAFAQWIRSIYKENVSEDHILVLTNEKATLAQLDASFDWLIEKCKPGDRVFIYFSGHGDAENKTRLKRGFLLCYDSPPNNYPAGAYGLIFLQDKLTTLSIDNQSKVYVFMDACRAGTLAGSIVGGQQATAEELARQYANENKFLSCQPDEYSYEGKQWGGGRGVFSYHLVEGLYGLADANQDLEISLLELGRYVQDKVLFDIDPIQQTPIFLGKPTETVTSVNPENLSSYLGNKRPNQKQNLMLMLESRGLEEQVLVQTDSIIRKLYSQFNAALASGNYLTDDSLSANSLLEKLLHIKDLIPLHSTMKRNFAVALQNEVQQAINALLASDPEEVANWKYYPLKYSRYPAYLDKAIALIGTKNIFYKSLLAKKLYFEAYLIRKNELEQTQDPVIKKEAKSKIINLLSEGLALDSSAAYLYHELASTYFLSIPSELDSLIYWNSKALELAPSWILPYLEIAEELQVSFSDRFYESEVWLKKALNTDSTSYIIKERLSWLYQRQNQTEKTIELANQIVKQKPHLPNGYFTLLNTYAFRREFIKMKENFEIFAKLGAYENHMAPYFLRTKNSHFFIPYLMEWVQKEEIPLITKNNYLANLAVCYFALGNLDSAQHYINICHKNPGYYWFYLDLFILEGRMALQVGNYSKADSLFRKSMSIDPSTSRYCKGFAWQAVIAEELGNYPMADSLYKLAVNSWLGSAWDDFYLQEECHFLYGQFLTRQKRNAEAEKFFLKANELAFQNGYYGWFGLACLHTQQGDQSNAIRYLQNALDKDLPLRSTVENEELLRPIISSHKVQKMLDKAFNH